MGIRSGPALAIGLFVATLLAGCGPGPGTAGEPGAGRPSDQAPKTLVYIVRTEPDEIPASGTAGGQHATTARFFNAHLAMIDQKGIPLPYLAEALPQLGTDTWRVFPDGRMETIYRLKPNIRWHDGTPLSAEDYVLSWKIRRSPFIEHGSPDSTLSKAMDEAVASDPRTVTIRWARPHTSAGALIGELPARPVHILAEPFQRATGGDPAALDGQPYWRTEYLGLGPYRLTRWEPGSFIEGEAFDRYVFGRPKIDRIRLIFMSDPNTVVANLLSGAAHMVGDAAVIRFQQGVILQREWEPRQSGTVLFIPAQIRYAQFQFRPDYANPRSILDVRVRRALAHATDRQALADGLFEGQGRIAYGLAPPTADYFDAVDRAVTKYPYDPRRVEQLLTEAGLTRGADGFFVSPSEGPFTPEWRASSGGDSEQQLAILVDGLRRAGIAATSYLLPQAQDSDRMIRATFPTLSSTSTTGAADDRYASRTSDDVGTPENRWAGGNRGGWSHPENDRLVDALRTTLDRAKRNDLTVQAARLTSDEVSIVTLYYNLDVLAHVAAFSTPWLAAPDGTIGWNIQDWELR